MGRGIHYLMGVLIMATGGCGAVTAPSVRFYVDEVSDGIAVVETDTGEIRRIHVRSLPGPVREGDVVVDGRVDVWARRELEERLRQARSRLEIRRAGGLDLDDSSNHRLTTDPE